MPFSGGGFSNFGFGGAAPGLGATSQADGVAAYGSVWASSNCPPCNIAIVEMQVQLVRIAGLLGLPTSTSADGKVGAGTVSLLQNVGLAANSRGLAWGAQLRVYTTAEAVAKNADKIRDVLMQAQVTPVPNAPAPSMPSGGAGPVATYVSPAPMMPAYTSATVPLSSKIPAPYLIGGGILLIGLITAAVIVMTPSKE